MGVSCLYTDDLRALIAARLADFAFVQREDAAGLKRAAVTIVIVPLSESPTPNEPREAAFFLTARAAKLQAHASQLALPGGRVDPGETLEQGALRELAEELTIDLAPTAILGRLDDYPTRSGYLIAPFVAWAPPDTIAAPNTAEVATVFRIPLAELRRPDAPEVFSIEESTRPVIRLLLPTLKGRVNAPTAALLYQFREVALEGRPTRVDHFDQPAWAWR
ncbi:MAG TPA: CoA pyrophosphatase [Stellaceae bacterium]|nr:CoA pyrophosphatase [Stellaceae bacterium]